MGLSVVYFILNILNERMFRKNTPAHPSDEYACAKYKNI